MCDFTVSQDDRLPERSRLTECAISFSAKMNGCLNDLCLLCDFSFNQDERLPEWSMQTECVISLSAKMNSCLNGLCPLNV